MISDTYSHQGALNWPESTFGYVTPTPSPALGPAAVPVTSLESLNWTKSCCLPGSYFVIQPSTPAQCVPRQKPRNERNLLYKELTNMCAHSANCKNTLIPSLHQCSFEKSQKNQHTNLTGEKGILVKGQRGLRR